MPNEYIEQRNGGCYLAGTRISLDSVVSCFNQGQSPEAIQEGFPSLKRAQGCRIGLETPPGIHYPILERQLPILRLWRSYVPVLISGQRLAAHGD